MDNNDNTSQVSESSELSVESLILSDPAFEPLFDLGDDETLKSNGSSDILDEAFEKNKSKNKDPIYDDFYFKFSLTDLTNNSLNNLMEYSLNNKEEENEIEENIIDMSNNEAPRINSCLKCICNAFVKWFCQEEEDYLSEIEWLIKQSRTWSQFIYYYWVGLFDNIRHKRMYLEYCNQVSNLKKKIESISEKMKIHDKVSKLTLTEEGENRNYFKIESYDTNKFDIDELFSTNESNRILLEIEDIFKFIDKLLIKDIIFMKNAKAPIGDFFEVYNSIKNNCLKISKIKNNKIFLNARCLTEIKQYKNNINMKDIREKFNKEVDEKIKKEFEDKFKDDFIKDNDFIEKDKFLFYLKNLIKGKAFSQKDNNSKEIISYCQIINYCNRQKIYFNFIGLLYSVYRELNSANNDNLMDKLNKYVNSLLFLIGKDVQEYYKKLDEEQIKSESQKLTKIFKESYINKNDFYMDQSLGISINKCFWKYKNSNIIRDIFDLIEIFNKFDIKNDEKYSEILKFVDLIIKYLGEFEEEEISFESSVLQWMEILNKKYKKSIFSEKEIWWYYYVYNSKFYYKHDFIINPSCCFPNQENVLDLEKGLLINNDPESIDEMIFFLETKKYLHHDIDKERPKHPLNKDFRWDELEFDPDKVEFSKRQFRYRKYYIENLNDELIENQLDQISKLNESLVRKNFILDCIENVEEVLNELENMGNFIREGVLLNEQLFFKLVLFGINFLIFIGQYFWNNHIKPSI